MNDGFRGRINMGWNLKDECVRTDGMEMQYVSFGSGKKKAVFLPGLSDGLASVKGKAFVLAAPYRKYFSEFTIYMFSRRNNLAKGISIQDMADDQAAAMKELEIEKAYVLGVSEGGMIAQALAASYPQMVEKLVIAVSAPYANETAQQRVRHWLKLTEENNHKELMIDTAENSYSEKYLKAFRMTYPLLGKVGKPKDYLRFQANAEAILSFDGRTDAEKIACPVLIIGGKDDRIVTAEASFEMKELIPSSHLYMYEGLGHGLYEEASDFNDRVFSFFSAENK